MTPTARKKRRPRPAPGRLGLDKHETRIHETANGGRHYIYRYPEALELGNPRPHTGIDVKGEGGYIVWADGDNYRVIHDVEPAELPRRLAMALQSKKPSGDRVDPTSTREQVWLAGTGESFHIPIASLAARLAGAGVRRAETTGWIYGLGDIALRNTEGERRERIARGMADGELDRIVDSAYAKFAPFPEDDDYLFDPWQEYPRTPPPLDALPPKLGELVDAVSKASGTDPSAALLSALVVASAAISAEIYTCPAANQPTWRVRPTLWGMIVGDVSAGKSPAAKALKEPLDEFQKKLWREY